MDIDSDTIAKLVLNNFASWEKKRKPLDRAAGGPQIRNSQGREIRREWVPLSGIVAQRDGTSVCIASATGMKCLPRDKIHKAQGVTIHDWHAEILALRSFNRFLLEECQKVAQSGEAASKYIRFRNTEERTETHSQPFALHNNIRLYMYCSEAPCGDASMELIMAAQEDSTPWTNPSSVPNTIGETPILHGRGYFSDLGAVRRKPSRPDAPPTLSKSCSDKISAKQATSILSSAASLLISPENCYLDSLTLPESQYSEVACLRAFTSTGRLAPLAGETWSDGYAFRPFTMKTTTLEFDYSRRQPLQSNESLVPSNIASSWTPNGSETIIGGTQQGKRQFSAKGASTLSKRRIWALTLAIANGLPSGFSTISDSLDVDTYAEVKDCDLLERKRQVKRQVRATLKGWQRNEDKEDWGRSGVEV